VSLELPLSLTGMALREHRARDIPRLCALADDYEIWRRVSDEFPRPYDAAAALRWIEDQAAYDPPRSLAIAEGEELIGGVGLVLTKLSNYAHDAELGYWLGRRYWGRGIATAAVSAFVAWAAPVHGLGRFTAKVFAGNEASVGVLRRCGFQHEGTLRGAARKEGVELDVLIFGYLVP
jgi:ribosomal-protein-alanine N-acetyltransferase